MCKGKTWLAIILIFVMVFSLAGCGEKKQATTSSAASSKKQADIVVIGTGMAGLSAAIEATQQGAKVILLEREAAIGGNTNFAEGILGTDSSLQKKLGISADTKKMLVKEAEFSNYKIDMILWKKVFNMSAANVDWLLNMGTKFHGVLPIGDTEPTWHVYEGLGKTVIKDNLKPMIDKLGIEILLSTPAKEIIMKDGRVAGIKAATADGKELIVEAKAVVIATGGFSENPEMVEQLTKIKADQVIYRGTPGHMGDGIKMAQKVGANTDGSAIVCLLGNSIPGFPVVSHLGEAVGNEPTNLWVNQNGERFVNEDIIFHVTRSPNAVLSQQKAFSVIDTDAINRVVTNGSIFGVGMYVPPGTKLTKINEELQQALADKNPYVFKGDTLEELAAKMGVDKAKFLQTMNNYNSYAASGADADYGKNPKFMLPIKTGPFYGFVIKPNMLNSMGGIRTNENSEVLDKEWKPIKGLYAAGMDVSGYTGDTYGINIPGSCQGVALATGRIGADSAVKYIKTVQ